VVEHLEPGVFPVQDHELILLKVEKHEQARRERVKAEVIERARPDSRWVQTRGSASEIDKLDAG
jgi:hypothetical protein